MAREPCAMQTDSPSPSHPGYTKSGRRKKPDKWANILKSSSQKFEELQDRVASLEEEQRTLRVKEVLLLQLLETLQALVVDAASPPARPCLPGAPAAAAAAEPAAATPVAAHSEVHRDLPWMIVRSTVQQQEQEINRQYGQLLSRLYRSRLGQVQQQLQGVRVLKALCSSDCVDKVRSMTQAQLTARLSDLAGKCALELLRTPPDKETKGTPLDESHLEYSLLTMSAMIWDRDKFATILHTNLDTQQPFDSSNPLPAAHWINALQKVDLSEQQLHTLTCVVDMFGARTKQLAAALERNAAQQAAHDASLTKLLLEKQQQQQGLFAAAAAATAPAPASATGGVPGGLPAMVDLSELMGRQPGAAAAAGGGGRGCGPQQQQQQQHREDEGEEVVQHAELIAKQAALVEEQQQLVRQWLLVGIHVGIVTLSTMNTYQQAGFIAYCYPSVPRMDMAITAWREQQQQAQQAQPERRNSEVLMPLDDC